MKKFAVALGALAPASLFAATDIAGVITDVSGYWDAALVVGIAVLLFVIGRKVVRKGI